MAARAISFHRAVAKLCAYHVAHKAVSPNAMLGSVRHIYGTQKHLGVRATRINMPALSPTMSEGTIVKWHKKEGEIVRPGDVLCDIQTDKAVVSMDTEENGILARIMIQEDSHNVKLGTLIALMVEEGEDWSNVEIPTLETPGGEDPLNPVCARISSQETSARVYFPAVRSLLNIYGISPADIKPSGPQGRLLKGDVLEYIKAKSLTRPSTSGSEVQKQSPPIQTHSVHQKQSTVVPSPPEVAITAVESEEYTDLPISNMRRAIAKRLTESKQTIPYLYASANCLLDKVLSLRRQHKKEGMAVSVNDFIIKAAASALRTVPEVNSVWTPEGPRVLPTVDVSVAVAIPSGLITPVIRDCDVLGVHEISACVKELAGLAREGKLRHQQYQGGSFSISNLGMYGITEFTAIINPPQTAILSVGTSRLTLGPNGQPQTVLTITLSADNRVIDESKAFSFIQTFKKTLENPETVLLGTSHRETESVRVNTYM